VRAVMRGLTDEHREVLDAASVAVLHCKAGGSAPAPREALRAVDTVRTTRSGLSREPAGVRILSR
jgi:hypothetical protein